MNAWLFVLVALAVYRLSYLVAVDTGPFAVCERVRSGAVARWGASSWQAEGVSCPACVSFWLAWPAALVLRPQDAGEWALYALALAGAVLVLHRGIAP